MLDFHMDNCFIRMGMTASENWEIIDQMKSTDVWMHLKACPSSHAMIRMPKKIRDNPRLAQYSMDHAARMICHQSSRRIPRNAERVEFIYSRAMYVKKGRAVGEAIMVRPPDEFSIENPV